MQATGERADAEARECTRERGDRGRGARGATRALIHLTPRGQGARMCVYESILEKIKNARILEYIRSPGRLTLLPSDAAGRELAYLTILLSQKRLVPAAAAPQQVGGTPHPSRLLRCPMY